MLNQRDFVDSEEVKPRHTLLYGKALLTKLLGNKIAIQREIEIFRGPLPSLKKWNQHMTNYHKLNGKMTAAPWIAARIAARIDARIDAKGGHKWGLLLAAAVTATLLSCVGNNTWRSANAELTGSRDSYYYNSLFRHYQFQNSEILTPRARRKLGLDDGRDTQYVLFGKYNRNFSTPGTNDVSVSKRRERLYLIGERSLITEATFHIQEEFYDLWLILEKGTRQRPERHKFSLRQLTNSSARETTGEIVKQNEISAKTSYSLKNFFLSVQDFTGDGRDDLFFSFEQNRRNQQFAYYLYRFIPADSAPPGETAEARSTNSAESVQAQAIVRPWADFSQAEHQDGSSRHYSPFMRELSADIYPAFIAEIELDLNYKININLSSLADSLIRDQVYDKDGMILKKRGIPHLDFNPILLPVRYQLGRYLLRSVQQVRNRYGQLGILVCNWLFRDGRWRPDESSLEFLAKPRV